MTDRPPANKPTQREGGPTDQQPASKPASGGEGNVVPRGSRATRLNGKELTQPHQPTNWGEGGGAGVLLQLDSHVAAVWCVYVVVVVVVGGGGGGDGGGVRASLLAGCVFLGMVFIYVTSCYSRPK
jgi:hypothetical protein